MINHTWNVYNVLFDHLDIVQKKLDRKALAKTPWIPKFIIAIDAGTEKLREYHTQTGGPMEIVYALAAMLDPS